MTVEQCHVPTGMSIRRREGKKGGKEEGREGYGGGGADKKLCNCFVHQVTNKAGMRIKWYAGYMYIQFCVVERYFL